MDAATGVAFYPLMNSKIVHLVRHAQGIHNVAGEKDRDALSSYAFFDAQLSPLGWQQVDNLREQIHSSGLIKGIELVITSPLLRAMQTAAGVFGTQGPSLEVDAKPVLMVENVGNSGRPEVSSDNCPPFIAVELCRERTGVHPCDKRRSVSEYRSLFPAIDFSLIGSNEDTWWKPENRENFEDIAARGRKFTDWLWTRQEREIAIVTHDRFLENTLNAFVNNSDPSTKAETCKKFQNCELRSFVIVKKGAHA